MKRIFLLLMAASLSSYVAVNTYAGNAMTWPSATKFDEDYMNRTVPVTQVYNDLMLEGTIVKLDRSNGSIELETDAQGTLALQFLPAALDGLNVGDPVAVHLGFGINDRTISAESCSALPVKLSTC